MAPRKPMREYKVVLLGEAGVGKEILITKYCLGFFSDQYDPTGGGKWLPKKKKEGGLSIGPSIADIYLQGAIANNAYSTVRL
jgi:GTPase SAR1 family protein